jgi:MerR family transcriptional regulator/heat shock protein HspR
LIPIKSPKGTRYFTEADYVWIGTVLRLVREARLNFAGIRHLLALLPCYEIRNCGFEQKEKCPITKDATTPCWNNRACCSNNAECYTCPVYRSAPACQNLKALLVANPARSMN